MPELGEEWNKRNDSKKWMRMEKGNEIYKACAQVILSGQKRPLVSRIASEAAALMPVPPERDTWEPELYKMVGKKGDK